MLDCDEHEIVLRGTAREVHFFVKHRRSGGHLLVVILVLVGLGGSRAPNGVSAVACAIAWPPHASVTP